MNMRRMPTPSAPHAPNAQEIARGVLRLLQQHDYMGVTEMTLANHRRADIAALGPKGDITIIEIKSCAEDFRSDQKWPEYKDFCDHFYFAVGHNFPRELIPGEVGLIVADGFGGAFLRQAPEEKIAAARRKAVTLRFARLAAQRLSQGLSPT